MARCVAIIPPTDEERTYTEWLLDQLQKKGVKAEMSYDGFMWRVAWSQSIPNMEPITGNLRASLPSVINQSLSRLEACLLHPNDYLDEAHVEMILDRFMMTP